MERYRGMEDLLQRVRARLDVEQQDTDAVTGSAGAQRDEYYSAMSDSLLLLLQESQHLKKRMRPGRLKSLSGEQQNDLRAIMSKVLREMLACRSKLEEAGEE